MILLFVTLPQLSILTSFALTAELTFDNKGFEALWKYSDKAVAEGQAAGRGYTWGPTSLAITREHYEYQKIEGTERQVEYFDKGRMELNEKAEEAARITAGLLVVEMVSGRVQEGDTLFETRLPAQLQVAGDSNQAGLNSNAPTYASFGAVATLAPGQNKAPDRTGQLIQQSLNKAGQVSNLENPPAALVNAYYEPVTGHNVAQVFADYQKITGRVWDGSKYVDGPVYTAKPLLIFGYPLSDPYWVKTAVRGVEKSVLVQLFERRSLTYTPDNPEPFKVEMGNIGQHYYQWRFNTTTPAPPSRLNSHWATSPEPGHFRWGVRQLIFAPDGKVLYTAGPDGFIRCWNFAAGQETGVFRGNQSGIYQLALSPDGKTLASEDWGGFNLWDTASGRLSAKIKFSKSSYFTLNSLAFSPDSRIVAYDDEDGDLHLREIASGKELGLIHTSPSTTNQKEKDTYTQQATFSPDGKYLAALKRDGVKIWRVADGQQVASLAAEGRALAFSPNGKYLAAGGEPKYEAGAQFSPVYLWNWADGRLVNGFQATGSGLLALAFSPDGSRLLTATDELNGTARVWDVNSGQEVITLKGHQREVLAVAFSPDGKTMATASEDQTVKTWDSASGKERLTFGHNNASAYSLAVSRAGDTIAVGTSGGDIRLLDAATGQPKALLKGHQAAVNSLAFSPDGKLLASGSGFDLVRDGNTFEDYTVRLWDLSSGKELYRLTGHQGVVWAVTFSPDGKLLASAGEDRQIIVWDVATGQKNKTLSGSTFRELDSLAFSPDGKTLAVGGASDFGSGKSPIDLLDLASGKTILTLKGHKDEPVRALAFSPDGQTLYSGGDYYTFKSWRLSDGQQLLNIDQSGENLVLSPDGRTVAVADYGGDISLWDSASGRELSRTKSQDFSGNPTLAISSDGQTLVSGHLDGSIKSWQLNLN